jgi:hypothetical protein
MNLTGGIALLVLFGLMIWFGKPKGGVQPFFMQIWIIGLYDAMSAGLRSRCRCNHHTTALELPAWVRTAERKIGSVPQPGATADIPQVPSSFSISPPMISDTSVSSSSSRSMIGSSASSSMASSASACLP